MPKALAGQVNRSITIEQLFKESAILQSELLPALGWQPSPATQRSRLSRSLGLISFEHGTSVLELYNLGKHTSGTSLLRLQYEALVRSVWVHYCASDSRVAYLVDDHELLKPNHRLEPLGDMLNALEERAPRTMVLGLNEFRQSSWRPLSSYVHSGLHAARWTESGFPGWLLTQSTKACNGLLTYSAMHLAELTGERERGFMIAFIAHQHLGCLPDFREDAAG